jgi:hypothetical protein
MRLLLAVLLIVSLFLSSLALAETLASPSGQPNVPVVVFKSEKSMDEGIKFLNAGGSILNYKVFGQYVRAIPDSGTNCLIVKSKLGKQQVRILEGPHKGKIGWVPSEMVK